MILENLNKEELIKLKKDIDNKLKIIDIKLTKPEKKTILSLNRGDKIFGIRLSFGGHQLCEPEDLNGEVDIIDYCNITEMNLRGADSNDFRITISHPDFGISTTLYKDDYMNEHCFLHTDTMKTGYDSFYTLKPNTWKEDLKIAFDKHLIKVEKRYQDEILIYQNKFDLFIRSEEKINKFI